MNRGEAGEAPLVSVVVPFFNVAGYADACLRSLEAQTFPRCEFVCVNDGSTDGTERMLAQHATCDPRIRVIRIEHSGLSVARNRGVEAARAELVTFVDGDDVVSPEYVRALYETYSRGEAEHRMAVVLHCNANSRGVQEGWGDPSSAEIEVMNRDDALREVCLRRIWVTAWGRLAPRRLYLDVPFPPGMTFEDGYITPDHIARTDELLLLHCSLYGYVTREGSITRRDQRVLKDVEDIRAAAVHVEQISSSWGLGVRSVVPWYQAIRYRSVMWQALGVRDGRATRSLRREASSFMRVNMRRLMRIRRENGLAWKSLAGFLTVGYLPHMCWLALVVFDLLPVERRRALVNRLKRERGREVFSHSRGKENTSRLMLRS